MEYLKFQAKFYDYSFNNIMMILNQFPTASRVAGFKSWEKLGRRIKKGSKAIKILAPRIFNKESVSINKLGEEVKTKKMFFARAFCNEMQCKSVTP